jgi:dienelactone hydrolase
MDANVGKGFEVPVSAGDSDGGAICATFAGGFAEDPAATERLLDTKDLNFALYSLYRPANMKEREKYPVITWGNGTCAMPEGYGALLRYTASHGFIVVAPNSRWVGSNSPMTKALDFIEAADKDSMSPIFGRADLTKIGAMGHSQGGGATITASRDARIKTVIIWNGGTGGSKPYLAVSGDRDISGSVGGMRSAVQGASKAAFLWYHMIPGTGTASGHLTLMTQPERVVEPTVAWFKMMFDNHAESKAFFVGTSCKLCGKDAEFEFGQKGLE